MMKKVLIEKPGSYDKLQIIEEDEPKLGPHDVLVAVEACGINFADCCVRMGVYSSAKVYVGWPITPGFEVAGEVIDVGEKVTRFSVGQKVIALTRFGGYTTHLAVSENQVFTLPEMMSSAEGAAFLVVYLTAYYALFELAHPRPGQTLLVHSAAGGVGSALVQLGKLAGCRVIGVVGASHKVDEVEKLGADAFIDKTKEDLWEAVERLAPDGIDVVLDANGPETLKESYTHLAPGGKLVVYGFHTMLTKGRGTPNWLKAAWDYFRAPQFNPMHMTTENHSVMAFNLSYLFDKHEQLNEAVEKLLSWVSTGQIMIPHVTTYPFEDVSKAHQDLESGKTTGKLVLVTQSH